MGGREGGFEDEKRLELATNGLPSSHAGKCESSSVLILSATLLGNYLYFLLAEGETEALPGFKVFAVSCMCDVPCMVGRMQLRSLEEAVRLRGENSASSPNHVTLGNSLNCLSA